MADKQEMTAAEKFDLGFGPNNINRRQAEPASSNKLKKEVKVSSEGEAIDLMDSTKQKLVSEN